MSTTQVLSSLDNDTLEKFINSLVDDLTGTCALDINSLVPRVFPSTEAAGSAVCEAIKLINDTINDEDGSGDVNNVITECVSRRREDIRTGLDNLMTCHSTNPPFLTQYDWKIKYIFSSNKMSNINEPLVNLDLKLSDGTGDSIEMNHDEVKQFLETLKQARSELS